MSELTSQAIGSAVETIEWRRARQEDGPVWVALTREGRASLLPREALTEPTRRLAQDRREREEELHYFLSELSQHPGECFLLWYAGSVVGRVCFSIKENEAYVWGLALHYSTFNKQEIVPGVVQGIINRAAAAGVARVTAVFEASHLSAFKAQNFRVFRRYSTMVCETEEKDDFGPDPERQGRIPEKINESKLPYRIRLMNNDDLTKLPAKKHDGSSQNGNTPSAKEVLDEEIAQLMGGQRYEPIADCAYVAEQSLDGLPKFLGLIQVSQWRQVAVITKVFVPCKQRRRGVGKVLVNHARLELIERNYPTMMATINESSRAQQFFRFMGFRDVQQCTIVARLRFPAYKQPRIAGT